MRGVRAPYEIVRWDWRRVFPEVAIAQVEKATFFGVGPRVVVMRAVRNMHHIAGSDATARIARGRVRDNPIVRVQCVMGHDSRRGWRWGMGQRVMWQGASGAIRDLIDEIAIYTSHSVTYCCHSWP